MQTLRHTFGLLQCLGLWRPVHWSPGWRTNLYYCYTLFIVLLVTTVILSEFIELLNSMDDVDAFANNSFMLLTLVADGGKGTNILMRRGEIIALTNILQEDPCKPTTDMELAIQRKFDKWARSIAVRYWTLVAVTLLAIMFRSLMEDVPQRLLPYEAWIPFNCYESLWGYAFVYTHQTVAVIISAGIGISFDTLVSGLMVQTCGQLQILKHRFHEIPQLLHDSNQSYCSERKMNVLIPDLESKLLSQCVKHHNEIFKFAKTSNDLFGIMIFLQYTITTVVLCVSVFGLSKMTLFSAEFIALFIYLACMGVQIFIYCYYGCEVTIESLTVSDAIYATDWDSLSVKAQRSLLTIMARTLRPIEFTSGSLLTLNLDYFNKILKLSYSAYNVLQQSSE